MDRGRSSVVVRVVWLVCGDSSGVELSNPTPSSSLPPTLARPNSPHHWYPEPLECPVDFLQRKGARARVVELLEGVMEQQPARLDRLSHARSLRGVGSGVP